MNYNSKHPTNPWLVVKKYRGYDLVVSPNGIYYLGRNGRLQERLSSIEEFHSMVLKLVS